MRPRSPFAERSHALAYVTFVSPPQKHLQHPCRECVSTITARTLEGDYACWYHFPLPAQMELCA